MRLGLALVRGASMEPTLRDGDRLLVRYNARPRPGRLAVVRLPPDDDGRLRPVAVKRLSYEEAGGWWVDRDNPAYGVDSWQVGLIAREDLVAVVIGRLWPRPSFLRRGHGGGARPGGRR